MAKIFPEYQATLDIDELLSPFDAFDLQRSSSSNDVPQTSGFNHNSPSTQTFFKSPDANHGGTVLKTLKQDRDDVGNYRRPDSPRPVIAVDTGVNTISNGGHYSNYSSTTNFGINRSSLTPKKIDANDMADKIEKKSMNFHLTKDCINPNCKRNTDEKYPASKIAINFFKKAINSETKYFKKYYLCGECNDIMMKTFQDMANCLMNKQPIHKKITKLDEQTTVEISDSSDEEDDDVPDNDEGEFYFGGELTNIIENELDSIIQATYEKYNCKEHNAVLLKHIEDQITRNEANQVKLNAAMNKFQVTVDQMRLSIYEVAPINEKFDVSEAIDRNSWLPVAGNLVRPNVLIGGIYYAEQFNNISQSLGWRLCKVVDTVTNPNAASEIKMYKVKFNQPKAVIDSVNISRCTAYTLAFTTIPKHRLLPGVRVIASIHELIDNSSLKRPAQFCAGVIAEPMQRYNHNRYLVFFDDGQVQYVLHNRIRVMCDQSLNVWEDVQTETCNLLEAYFRTPPIKRAMVRMEQRSKIVTEIKGRWLTARVATVDASLCKMFFDSEKRFEWLYRGSQRFWPIIGLKSASQGDAEGKNKTETCIEYVPLFDDESSEDFKNWSAQNPLPNRARAVARKSTATTRRMTYDLAKTPPVQSQLQAQSANLTQRTSNRYSVNKHQLWNNDRQPSGGVVVFFQTKKIVEPKRFTVHDCDSSCIPKLSNILRTYGTLSRPLISGWQRLIFKARPSKMIAYRAPCGRTLTCMDDIYQYLRKTQCKLNVECFDFDVSTHCLAEWSVNMSIIKTEIKDLSCGKEAMPITCVNTYDSDMPPPCVYSAQRIPTHGVQLNVDPEFLCGCDCTDDCSDKTKCACALLTYEGAKAGNPDIDPRNVGYLYKRLVESVPTGIYECNARCHCNDKCLNRVVQEPLKCKLQVFKTHNRGWGLRTIGDIANGAFVCIYAGKLLTELAANSDGANAGDEYFAELDYIEVVEKIKEDYEANAPDLSSEGSDDECAKTPNEQVNDDSDEEFRIKYKVSKEQNKRSITLRPRKRESSAKDLPNGSKKTQSVGDKTNATLSTSTSKLTKLAENNRTRKNYDNAHSNIDTVEQIGNGSASDESDDDDCITISDDDMDGNSDYDSNTALSKKSRGKKAISVRQMYGRFEAVYVMDAKVTGNIGRYFNHSCDPNLFVQNVFVDTHDLRFPWVAFFANGLIKAGSELTWNYNYDVGSVPGKVLYCQCGAGNCRGRLL